jgi:diphthamide synthase subunit DPH2
MTVDEYAAKKERLQAIESLIASDGWSIFLETLQTQRNRALAEALNLTLSHAERDGAAGAVNALEEAANSMTAKANSIKSTLGGERKRRQSANPPVSG